MVCWFVAYSSAWAADRESPTESRHGPFIAQTVRMHSGTILYNISLVTSLSQPQILSVLNIHLLYILNLSEFNC